MKNLKNKTLKAQRLVCRKKFLYYFPKGFQDKKYLDWERGYKEEAHLAFKQLLNALEFKRLLRGKEYTEIASMAIRIESKTNLLFSFEKMALRDAVKSYEGAKVFAEALFNYIYGKGNYIYGKGNLHKRFDKFTHALSQLPRKQTRVLTWPLQTVFGFIANPLEHIFLKPRVTQLAALHYGFDFEYKSKPNWNTYQSVLAFAEQIRTDIKDLHPRDFIDLQSFIWVLGSSEYPD